MKRLIYAGIILLLTAVAAVFSVLHTDAVTQEMIDKLLQAHAEVEAQHYDEALALMDEFDDIYHRNETFFILFVRRDQVYHVHTTAASLRDYANETNQNDFLADVMRTIEYIEVIRFNIIRIN